MPDFSRSHIITLIILFIIWVIVLPILKMKGVIQ